MASNRAGEHERRAGGRQCISEAAGGVGSEVGHGGEGDQGGEGGQGSQAECSQARRYC